MLQIAYPNHSSGREKHIFEHKVNSSGKIMFFREYMFDSYSFFFFFCAQLPFPLCTQKVISILFSYRTVCPLYHPINPKLFRQSVFMYKSTERFSGNSIVVVSWQSFYAYIMILFHVVVRLGDTEVAHESFGMNIRVGGVTVYFLFF